MSENTVFDLICGKTTQTMGMLCRNHNVLSSQTEQNYYEHIATVVNTKVSLTYMIFGAFLQAFINMLWIIGYIAFLLSFT